GGEERPDHELAGLDVLDGTADLLDDADVFVSHRRGPLDGLDAAVGPQVRSAHAGGGEPDDGVGGLDDPGVGTVVDPDVVGGVEDCSSHEMFPFSWCRRERRAWRRSWRPWLWASRRRRRDG